MTDQGSLHIILLSGGSGKRLWPLSNDVQSKQFLKILENQFGEKESMIQRVYRQLGEIGLSDSVTIAAGSTQKDQICMQLGSDVNLVLEPSRRDSFPAILLASAYLYSELNIGVNDNIVVLPVDSYVENSFFMSINKFCHILDQEVGDLVLLGAKPKYPTGDYGYVIPEDSQDVAKVVSFKEKPSIEIAEELISQGALWNCGAFGFKMKFILENFQSKHPDLNFDYQELQQNFLQLKKSSFDYEIVEKAKSIIVVRYMGYWKDLGTWNTLSEETKSQSHGSVFIDELSQSSYIINKQNIPMVVLGVEDSVIVSTYDGILVSSKKDVKHLKSKIQTFNQRPMYEKKRWGSYQVLEHTIYDDGRESLTKKIFMNKDCQISYQYHRERVEIWTIVSGEGVVLIDDISKEIGPGSVLRIDKMQKHAIKALTDLEMIEVQLGRKVCEGDIVRLKLDW